MYFAWLGDSPPMSQLDSECQKQLGRRFTIYLHGVDVFSVRGANDCMHGDVLITIRNSGYGKRVRQGTRTRYNFKWWRETAILFRQFLHEAYATLKTGSTGLTGSMKKWIYHCQRVQQNPPEILIYSNKAITCHLMNALGIWAWIKMTWKKPGDEKHWATATMELTKVLRHNVHGIYTGDATWRV